MKHAKLSPSSAYRWLNCPVSVKLSEHLISEKKADYLSEGRKAHLIAERELKKIAHQELPEIGFEIEPDMHETILSYINYITREVDVNSVKLEVEKEINLDWLDDELEIYGTADCIAYSDDRIDVFDLKYGIGHLVEDDSQLKLYALGALGEKDVDSIVTHIYQPRRGHIARGEYTKDELLEWYQNEVYPAGYRSLFQPVLAVRGEWCQFCSGRGYCKENKLDTDDFTVDTPVSELSIEEICRQYKELEKLEQYKKDLKGVIENELKNGRKLDGYVLKPGRKRREWRDVNKVREMSQKLGIEVDPLSPAKIEKKLGKAKFDQLFSEYVEIKEGRETVYIDHN